MDLSRTYGGRLTIVSILISSFCDMLVEVKGCRAYFYCWDALPILAINIKVI